MARNSQIIGLVSEIEEFTSGVVKKITLDVTANLEETTPVDTGWARANWVPSVGTAYDENLESQSGANRADFVNGAESRKQKGRAEVAAYSLEMGPCFISNNVPYIGKLNEGTSKQAPRAFVQAGIEKAVKQDIRG